jgi:hypothetical protein
VTAEKQGQFINYSLNTTVVGEFLKWAMQLKPLSKKTKTTEDGKRSFI